MDFNKLIRSRRSMHHFEPDFKLSDTLFKSLIDMVRYTPSGYNAQPWEFILIREEEAIKTMGEIAFNQTQIVEAGNAIVVLGDTKIVRDPNQLLRDWVKYGYCTQDQVPTYYHTFTKKRKEGILRQMALRNASFAAVSLLYAAESLGLQTCPMMGLSQPKLKTFLNIPEDRIPVLLIAIGKGLPDKEKPQLPRKEVEELIYFEQFGQK